MYVDLVNSCASRTTLIWPPRFVAVAETPVRKYVRGHHWTIFKTFAENVRFFLRSICWRLSPHIQILWWDESVTFIIYFINLSTSTMSFVVSVFWPFLHLCIGFSVLSRHLGIRLVIFGYKHEWVRVRLAKPKFEISGQIMHVPVCCYICFLIRVSCNVRHTGYNQFFIGRTWLLHFQHRSLIVFSF